MKKISTLTLILLICLTVSAQITITMDDYVMKGEIGDTLIYQEVYDDSLDLGSFGETSWDFTNLTISSTVLVEFIEAAATPFADRYLDATTVAHQVLTVFFESEIFNYLSTTDTSVIYHGESVTDSTGGFHIWTEPKREMFFPLDYGTSWTFEGTEYFDLDGDVSSNSFTVVNNVDSYGQLTLPSGKVTQALLLRAYEIRDFDGFVDTTKTYLFLTQTGDLGLIFGSYGEPDTGMVAIASSIWYEHTVTDIENDRAVTKDFQLKQNYPNPFNPSTTIEYSIPTASNVELKIYDFLGREITTLVNEIKTAGNYEIVFDANGLASGIYFARLKSGNYSQSIKLTLLK